MPEIYLPEKIIFGRNSIEKFKPDAFEKAMIISDDPLLCEKRHFDKLTLNCRKNNTQYEIVISENIHELYRISAEKFFSYEPEMIIAIGSAAAIDCAMLLTHESGAKFTAIPYCGSCGLTDFENADYYSYCHSPDTFVLDPALIEAIPSPAVVYDAVAAFSFAIDTLGDSDNIITHSLALRGAEGILKNLISAYRGEKDAIEKLMYAMYFSAAAHRNAQDKHSFLYETSRFFADFGYPRASVCAVIVPEIMEYEEQRLRKDFAEIARISGISLINDEPESASAKLIEKTRKINASVGIPRSISGFSLTQKAFTTHKIQSTIPDDILDTCYYGSFKFMKL